MTIPQDQLLKIYDDKTQDLFLLDVRTPLEFSEGHIPSSVNIPIDEIEYNLDKIPKDKNIITICLHGIRSGRTALFLSSHGYKVKSLQNGLSDWRGQIE